MKEKKIKRKHPISIKILIPLFAVVLIVIVNLIYMGMVEYANKKDYDLNKRAVEKYVAETYPTSEYVCETKIPDVKRVANIDAYRGDDMFIYYEKETDTYYEVVYEDNKIVTDHDEVLYGKEVTQEINTFMEENDVEIEHFLRSWSPKNDVDDREFHQSKIQLFFLTDDVEADKEKIFETVKYIQEEYCGLMTSLMICPTSERETFEKLFSFEETCTLMHVPRHYAADENFSEFKFESADDLLNFMNEE